MRTNVVVKGEAMVDPMRERERERERTKSEKGGLKGIGSDDDQRSSGDNGSLRPLVTTSLTSKHAKI